MHVKLKPLSHPELDEIVIDEPVFPVGRDETPFAHYQREVVANLSRRHARIFEEAGSIYVADVGSRNGTRLNGKAVEHKPMRIRRGDQIAFGGRLEFQVELLDTDDQELTRVLAGPSLVLAPRGTDPGLEAITVTSTGFPFLIGKSNPVFVASVGPKLERSEFLSRRHAHFFIKDQTLFLEDLGSTNGTYVNGKRLSEHAQPIETGDEIVFGASEFSYRATLKSSASEPSPAESDLTEINVLVPCSPVDSSLTSHLANNLTSNLTSNLANDGHGQARAEHTIFVSSANSFLDIFCVDEPEQAAKPDGASAAPAQSVDVSATQAQRTRKGIFRRLVIFVAELRAALKDESPRASPKHHTSRSAWLTFGGVMVVAAVGASLYLIETPKQQIKDLLDQQHYLRSAELASVYLTDHPTDEDVGKWATEALLKHLIPPWRASLEQANYHDALNQLERVRHLASAQVLATKLLDLLQWVTHLHQHLNERGGIDASVQLFQHEATITSLLQWWEQDERAHRAQLGLIVQYAPEFTEINRRTFSYLQALHNDRSVYLAAIDSLNQTTKEKLNADQAGDLTAIFSEFAEQYPRIAGVERLQQDLNNYLSLTQLLSDNLADDTAAAGGAAEWASIDAAFRRQEFNTPPFQDQVEQLQASYLPQRRAQPDLERAAEAWREGNLEQALAILEQLAEQEVGGALVTSQLNHKRQLLRAFQTLQGAWGSEEYERLLVDFHARLNAEEDAFLWHAIEADYRQLGNSTRNRAEQAWTMAQKRWDSYLDGGGILGAQRLENSVSERFRTKAKLLSEAHEQALKARQLSTSLALDISLEQAALYQKIIAETALQRRSLEQLSMVLSPALLEAKLNLLAESDKVKEERGTGSEERKAND